MFLGQFFLMTSFGIAMASSPTLEQTFALISFHVITVVWSYYVTFWMKYRKGVAKFLSDFVLFLEPLEESASDEEMKALKKTAATVKRIRYVMGAYTGLLPILFIQRPIEDIRLPSVLRGLSPYHPAKLILQVMQGIFIIQVVISAVRFTIEVVTVVFWSKTCLEIVAARFLHYVEPVEARKTAKLHSNFLSVVQQYFSLIQTGMNWLFIGTLALAVVSSVAIVVGVKSFDILWTVPLALSFCFLFCQLGDRLERAGSKITAAVYNCGWVEANPPVRKTLLCVLSRSQRSLVLRAPLLGPSSFKLYLSILKHWYRFFQMLLGTVNWKIEMW